MQDTQSKSRIACSNQRSREEAIIWLRYLSHIESIAIMRFKKGSKVEVLSKKEVSTGSWLCAEIISGNGHTYSVRYGWFPRTGEALVERAPRKAIRPCPPAVAGADNWVLGDHVEVFHLQNMSWKTATVMKVFGGNNFLVRLLGESQEFRAHRSHIKVRQSWQDDKWFVVGKGDAHYAMSMKKNQKDTNTKLYAGKDCFHVRKNMGIQEPQNSTRTLKRGSPAGLTYLESYNVAVQKVRAIEKKGNPKRLFAERSSPLSEKVDAYTPPQEKVGGKFVNTSFHVGTTGFFEKYGGRGKPNQSNGSYLSGTSRLVDTDSSASSVGSCSVNGNIPYGLPFCSIKHEIEDNENFCSDAESFCGPWYEEEGCYLSKNEELVAQDHRLELHSYHNAMKALYACGPLSWEDEMKVTDLRHALHISNEEHLVELRNLIAADTRIPIC